MKNYNLEPCRMYCGNCGHKILGYRKGNSNSARFDCLRCGALSISVKKTKRLIYIELYAPPNEVLMI